MPTATAKRKALYEKIHYLPDNAIVKVMDFIDSIDVDDIDEYEPNALTLEAMREAEMISRDPNVKGYTDIDEMMKDILADV